MSYNILVIGGAGFIGSHTVDALVALGYNVKVFDNLSERIHKQGMPTYMNKSAEYIVGDIRNKEQLTSAMQGMNVIYNFAAYQDYMNDFSTFFDINVRGTALIYEVILEQKLNIDKVIVASSQAVYGEGRYRCNRCGDERYVEPRTDGTLKFQIWDYGTCPDCNAKRKPMAALETESNPINVYGLSKLNQEKVALQLGARYNIPTVALRYSIVQGARQSLYNAYSGACRIFCLSYLAKIAPVIYEDGKQLRDFVNIHDVVDANILTLMHKEMVGKAYNIGGGKTYTISEFAEIVRKVFGSDIKPDIPGHYRFGDTRHIFSDIASIKACGWEPKRTPEESVKEYKSWIESIGTYDNSVQTCLFNMIQNNVIRKSDL